MRTLRYVQLFSVERRRLADFFNILLELVVRQTHEVLYVMTLIMPDTKPALVRDLRRLFGDDKVKSDVSSLAAYAVDASIYRLTPQAVVLVDTEEDIARVVRYAQQHGVPLTPRAAGTNLTGSAIGEGIIVDVSRMNRILEVNREERWVRVQPGTVYAELNRRLAKDHLLFGPDPSSGEMCKLGGMLANNSAGPHTLRYGSVKDNVLSVRLCLPSGGWVDAESMPVGSTRADTMLASHPSIRHVLTLVQDHAATIRAKKPTVSKNSSGYNLFGLVDGLDQGVIDLPKLFIGSEGTLGIVSEATLRLMPCPSATTTALIHCRNLDDVGDMVNQLLSLNPSALEVMDGNTLNLIGRSRFGIPGDAAATLLAEFDHESTGEHPSHQVREMADRMQAVCSTSRLAGAPVLASDAEQREQLWKARKALYPTLYRFDSKKKPINYVDDVVVRAERLGELVRYLGDYFGQQDIPVAIFGHIGNGNAHIVPLLDVNDPVDFTKMVDSYRAIHDTVLGRFEGSICGEHGDGRVRAEYVRTMFGDELYDVFWQVKRAIDPAGFMNPGVKLSTEPFTQHIDFERLGKPCATCAKCNAVCPIYDVFQSEDMSSRGWYEIVTAKDYSYLNSQRVVESCTNCKSCRTACPAGVDVSELILQKRAEHPNRLAAFIFRLQRQTWLFEGVLKLLAATQSLWDRPLPRRWLEILASPVLRQLGNAAKLPADMLLPRLAVRMLRDRYPTLVRDSPEAHGQAVAYFHGCAANYFDDGVGDAVIKVLRHYGIEPALPPQRCSGTPIDTYGLRDVAKEGARFNLTSLASYSTVVTGCASCTLMLKDYAALFRGEPEEAAAKALSTRVKHISEFVMERESATSQEEGKQTTRATGKKVTYHSSCHLRAAGVTKAPRDLLRKLPGYEFVEMQDADRCAGGAGTFMVKNPDVSAAIFSRKQRAIDESGADVVATSCPACMIQLRNGLKGTREVKHVAQLWSEALAATPALHNDGDSH
jgi:FAD/FMN-containing dehydrogenase/Fe-S oxidoreductase